MRHEELSGWNVGVHKCKILQPGENGGDPQEVDGWELSFEEVMPQSGHTISFRMNRDVRNFVVRELTGGIVLAGGELPRI